MSKSQSITQESKIDIDRYHKKLDNAQALLNQMINSAQSPKDMEEVKDLMISTIISDESQVKSAG